MSKRVDKVRMRFSGLAAQWLASIAQGVKESTLAHYYYTLQRYLLPVFGEMELSALDEQRLEQGILQAVSPADGSHRPLGASSARECLTMLRRICKYAAHLHLMRPVEIVVKLPQFERRQTVPLSAQEQANLRDFVLEHPTARKAGLLLQMQLGLRIGEVCGLQWGDFDLTAGTLEKRQNCSPFLHFPFGRYPFEVRKGERRAWRYSFTNTTCGHTPRPRPCWTATAKRPSSTPPAPAKATSPSS